MKNLLDENKIKKIYSFSRLFDDNFYILSEFIAARKKIEFNAIAYIQSSSNIWKELCFKFKFTRQSLR